MIKLRIIIATLCMVLCMNTYTSFSRADWVMIGGDLTHQNAAVVQPVINPTINVSIPLPETIASVSAPIVSNGIIYIDAGNCCMAFNQATGQSLWNYSANAFNLESTPCVGLYHIFFGSDDGNVYALQIESGALVWTYQTGGPVRSSPVIDTVNQILTVGSDDGYIYGFNALTGSKLWNAAKVSTTVTIGSATSNGTILSNYIYAFPITVTMKGLITTIGINWAGTSTGGNIKVALYSNVANAPSMLLTTSNSTAMLSAKGWQNVLVTPYSIDVGVYWIAFQADSSKLVYYTASKPNYYYPNSYGTFAAQWNSSASHNDMQWNTHLIYNDNIYASPSIHNNTVYCGTSAGHFYALNESRGTTIWDKSLTVSNTIYYPSTSVINENIIYFCAPIQSNPNTGMVFALNRTSGAILWSDPISTNQSFPALSLDRKTIYIGSIDSNLYAINSTNGNTLWHYTTSAPIVAAPIVAYNVIYVGSNDGSIYGINATYGELIWSLQMNNVINQPFAIANATIYCVLADPTIVIITDNNPIDIITTTTETTTASPPSFLNPLGATFEGNLWIVFLIIGVVIAIVILRKPTKTTTTVRIYQRKRAT